ncbi:MAG: hypothetical protein WBS14_06085, partial [Rhodomicrobium sp.]
PVIGASLTISYHVALLQKTIAHTDDLACDHSQDFAEWATRPGVSLALRWASRPMTHSPQLRPRPRICVATASSQIEEGRKCERIRHRGRRIPLRDRKNFRFTFARERRKR